MFAKIQYYSLKINASLSSLSLDNLNSKKTGSSANKDKDKRNRMKLELRFRRQQLRRLGDTQQQQLADFF